MSSLADARILDELVTLRDWLRYGTSCFQAAALSSGHGFSTATDDAAFLLLKALGLPVDQLKPWLDCRLTREERTKVARLFEQRITTRKPSSYLINEAWIQSHSFYVDERVIAPRSYIGELLADGLSVAVDDPDNVGRVLDLCTGSGCLAILAALAFPRADVVAIDVSGEVLEVAARNVAEYGFGDRINLVKSDLFEGLMGQRFDLIICIPPYVSAKAIAEFPPEFKAEPVLAHDGGEDGLDLVRRIIREAAGYLTPDGVIVVEVGSGRAILEDEFPDLPFLWLDTKDSAGEVFAISAGEFASAPSRSRKGGDR